MKKRIKTLFKTYRIRFLSFLLSIFLCFFLTAYSFASTVIYQYNKLNHLTRVQYSNGAIIEYTYDAAGNRISKAFYSSDAGMGDMDGNHQIELADSIIALQIICDIDPHIEVNTAADVNSDGKIGIEEEIYILQKVAGMR